MRPTLPFLSPKFKTFFSGPNAEHCLCFKLMNYIKIILAASLIFSEISYGNVLGTDFQNFNPTYSGIDYVTVHSSETLEPGVLNFGIFLNRAYNTLPLNNSVSEDVQRSRQSYSDSVTGMDLNFGLGLTRNWDFGVNFPYIVDQEIRSDVVYGSFKDRGNSEVRLNTKYRLWKGENSGLAVVGSANFNLVNDNPFTGQGAGPTYNLEMAADTHINQWALALNLGHRWRNPGTPINRYLRPILNSALASVGASYLFADIDTKMIFEIYGSYPTQSQKEISDKGSSNLEALLGVKHDVNSQLALHAGLSTEMLQGTASPDWRIYVGLNYALGPLWGGEEEALEEAVPEMPMVATTLPPTPEPEPPVELPPEYTYAAPQKTETFILYNVNFETNSYKNVYGSARRNLAKLAYHANRPPKFKHIVISGHADSTGPADYNLVLSRKRAQVIADYLIKIHKMDPSKIEVKAYGESRPIADNGNYQGRKKNRRVEFTIYR